MRADNDNSFRFLGVGAFFGFQDVRDRFSRSVLGPVWSTVGLFAQVGVLSVVMSGAFEQPLADTAAYISIGLIVWSVLSTVSNEAALMFRENSQLLLQLPLPLSFMVGRLFTRNLLVALFLLPVPLVSLSFSPPKSGLAFFLVFPGLILFLLFLYSVAVSVGYLATRYRDVSHMSATLLTILFYATPVFWNIDQLPDGYIRQLVSLNPIFHLLELIRLPLFGEIPSFSNWLFSLALVAVLSFCAILFTRLFSVRLVFWL